MTPTIRPYRETISCKGQDTHTPTENNTRDTDTHAHDKNNTPNPQTNTSLHQVKTHAQFANGHFALMRYAEFTVLGVQHCCSVPHAKEQIRFPKAAAEQRARQKERTNLLASWRAGMPASVASRYNSATLVTDVVSPLLTLLCPPFRNTASHILNSEEKALLTALVDNMLSFGLKLKHGHAADASHALTLEPPLGSLLPKDASADGTMDAAAELARQLPSHIKQLLNAELQRENLRRQFGAVAPAAKPAAPAPPKLLSIKEAAKLVKAPEVYIYMYI